MTIHYFTKYKQHYKETLKLGIPIVMGQIGIVLVGLVDNIMIGHYATQDLAASSFVNSVFILPILVGLGFSYGLTPLVGRLFGQSKEKEIGSLLKNSLFSNLIISLLLGLVMTILYLNIHRMGQPSELLPYIRPYFLLQLVSLPFVMLFNGFKQFADGITETKTPMWIMLSANLINIIGNFIFIFGYFGFPEMGLTGAGIATLIARIYMLIAFVVVFYYNPKYKHYSNGFQNSTLDKGKILTLNKMGGMIGLQMGMETALFSITGVMIGWFGATALASHQILISASTIGYMIYYGIGAAISVRISNYHGTKDYNNIKKACTSGLHLIMLLALFAAVFFFAIRHFLGYIFTSSEEVVEMVALLAVILSLYQLGDALQITYANALRGIGDVTAMALLSCIGYFLIGLSAAYLLAFPCNLGITGIWISYPIGLSVTGILLFLRFKYVTNTPII